MATTLDIAQRRSHISYFYSRELLKKLYAHALLIDIDNNNEKVDVIKELLPDGFTELAPGTNRVGFIGPDGKCHKIALDRRGIVDNLTEYKRSPAIEWCAPKVYETNGLVSIVEPVELISKEDFVASKAGVLEVCRQLSKDFIFEDIGFAMKNFCNWGMRNRGKESSLVILDTGYMIPIIGNEEAMLCPVCGSELRYNSTYTGFYCSSSRCNTKFSFIDVYRRLPRRQIDDEIYAHLGSFELPDLDRLNTDLYNSTFMKGGHVSYGYGASTSGDVYGGLDIPVSEGGTVRFEDIRDIARGMPEFDEFGNLLP